MSREHSLGLCGPSNLDTRIGHAKKNPSDSSADLNFEANLLFLVCILVRYKHLCFMQISVEVMKTALW